MALTLERLPLGEKAEFHIPLDRAASYDAMCRLKPHLVEGFETHWPHLASMVRRMRLVIPTCHVRGHKEDCTYEFASVYVSNTGNFKGETAEHPWVEYNQLGRLVRQMNAGHRQDMLDAMGNWWNWSKALKAGTYSDFLFWIMNLTDPLVWQRATEITRSYYRYIQHRETFLALTELSADHVKEWFLHDRHEQDPINSVYRHQKEKGMFS